MEITIHADAAKRFNELGEELLVSVTAERRQPRPVPVFRPDLHISANLTSKDVIGPIRSAETVIDGTGAEVGRFFIKDGQRIGFIGDGYKRLIRLLERIQKSGLEETLSMRSLVDGAFAWLEERHGDRTHEPIVSFVLQQISSKVKLRELWVPLHRVHLQENIAIGTAKFRTISKEMLDELESRMQSKASADTLLAIRAKINRERTTLQGTAAVVVSVVAEPIRASEIALEIAGRAAALLRFFSRANWHPLMRSYCTTLGDESLSMHTELTIGDGKILSISGGIEDKRNQHDWVITSKYLRQFPGLLQALSDLVDERRRHSEFEKKLLDALLLYSRNAVVQDPADKLVFIFASLESMLLRTDSEPVQKNVAERMAFLIGENVEARKQLIANVLAIYGRRSSFLHHGSHVDATDALATFMLNAWACFYTLLEKRQTFATKDSLIEAIEERKLQ